MTRKITLKSRDGVELEAEYEPHELEFMSHLRAGLDGPYSEWDKETMLMIHELKALLPGSRLLEEEPPEVKITWGGTEEDPTAWAEVVQETRKAIKEVDEHADGEWKQTALAVVRRTCEELAEFISDDIWARGLDSTREDRALGPVLMKAKKEGWCVKTDRLRPSVRSHLSGKPVWKSLIFQEAQLLFDHEAEV